MKTLIATFIFLTSLSCATASDFGSSKFNTPLGTLEFKNQGNPSGSLFDQVYIDGQLIFSLSGSKDWTGSRLYLMKSENELIKKDGKYVRGDNGLAVVNRFILSTDSDGNCLIDFIILDFSGRKPFVSNRFGPNPDGKFCLKFIRAKWGKKQSYITLSGPAKYLYTTGEDVIGPIE